MPDPILPPETNPAPRGLPRLVRLYLVNIVIGFGLALVFTGLLIGLDVAGLGRLVRAVPAGWIAVLMLIVFNTVLFAGVQFAIAVMRMADDGTPPRGGLRIGVMPRLRPAQAVARAPHRKATQPRN